MSRVLVLFGTTYGQTANVALAIEGRLRLRCHQVLVADAALACPRPADYDAVVIAASVHAGRYQQEVVDWVATHAATLNRMPTAFLSVCLGVLRRTPKVDRELRAVMAAFLETTGWTPQRTAMIAGAVHYTRYGALVRWLMYFIMKRNAPEMTRDYEFTDSDVVGRFADQFEAAVRQDAAAVA
jgi:menaquinone-dependent protoporphyrinogen oxidase